MNTSTIKTLFAGGHREGKELQRRMRDMQDKRASLLTHHDSSEFEESSEDAVIADEGALDELASQHRKDSKTFVGMVWLFAFCVVAALLKWKFGF
jgi:hypothetical protein